MAILVHSHFILILILKQLKSIFKQCTILLKKFYCHAKFFAKIEINKDTIYIGNNNFNINNSSEVKYVKIN
ncbi:hypothetical protein GCM10007380_30660 [Gottfriedia solisilvae]|uniref:Uncharacterized protein n=1 Tax=Gottfriedia solisilvae TaxID=1516104 RepID=A0A8J3ASA8_9BACI|nr:hypothetical protein GCM10007380_30660 [Gottfriedia solisilvae]